jgi:hypothetical protein
MIFIAPDLHRFCEAVYASGLPLARMYRAITPQDARARAEEWHAHGIESAIVDLDRSAADLRAAIEHVERSTQEES